MFDWSDTRKHSSFQTIMKCLENMSGGLISQPSSPTIESSSISSRFMIRRTESESPLVCRFQSMIQDTRWNIGERSLRMTLGGSWRSIRKKFQSNLRFITINSMNSLIVYQRSRDNETTWNEKSMLKRMLKRTTFYETFRIKQRILQYQSQGDLQ